MAYVKKIQFENGSNVLFEDGNNMIADDANVENKIERLKKYTPPFIAENEILESMYVAIGKALDDIDTAMNSLKDSYWVGKGLMLKTEETKTLTRQLDSEDDIRSRLREKLNNNKNRGTKNKVREELLFLINSGDQNDVEFYEQNECGFIVDTTYMDDPVTFVDVNKLIKVYVPKTTSTVSGSVYGNAVYGTDVYAGATANPSNTDNVEDIAKQEIVPLDVEILLEEK